VTGSRSEAKLRHVVGGDRELVYGERLLGLAAVAIALLLCAPLLVVIVAAAAVTSLARAFA
jgi:hypothetical protein